MPLWKLARVVKGAEKQTRMSEIRSRASIVADLVERDYVHVHVIVEVREEIYGIGNKLENLKIFFRRNK